MSNSNNKKVVEYPVFGCTWCPFLHGSQCVLIPADQHGRCVSSDYVTSPEDISRGVVPKGDGRPSECPLREVVAVFVEADAARREKFRADSKRWLQNVHSMTCPICGIILNPKFTFSDKLDQHLKIFSCTCGFYLDVEDSTIDKPQ